MDKFEKHPFIPEQSEEHPKLLEAVAEWKNRLADPLITERIRNQEGGAVLLNMLDRIRFGASGEVTLRPDVDDPDFSTERPPLYLTDDDLRGIDVWSGIAFERAELHSDD